MAPDNWRAMSSLQRRRATAGTIEVMTGITADGSVSGVVLLSQNETPGLGANATKESFTGQYQQAVPESGFEVIKSGGAADGQIQAMTGATIPARPSPTRSTWRWKNIKRLRKGEIKWRK